MTTANFSKSNPKVNLRGRLSENVTLIAGNEYDVPASVSASNTVGYGGAALSPGNTGGRTNAAVNTVGKYFQKGVYLPGTFFKYIPSVGLNTPGNIIVGFLDSPEVIRAWYALSAGNQLNFIRDLNNARTAPVWQEMVIPLTQPPRRKTFVIDSQILDTKDDVDMSMQGLYVWCVYGVESIAASRAYGQIMIHCKERFEEVKSFITAQPS